MSNQLPSSLATTGPMTELAAHLRLSTTRLARRLRREAEVGLSPSLLSALAVIGARGPLSLGRLAEIEGVAPPTVTKVVAKLESQGLVERIPDPDDRRVCRVAPTGPGAELLEDSRSRKTQWLAERLESLDDEDRAVLDRAWVVLDRLIDEDRG